MFCFKYFYHSKYNTMNSRAEQLKAFDRLLTIMDELREQCPWDKKQTMESIIPYSIEEIYEVAEQVYAKTIWN